MRMDDGLSVVRGVGCKLLFTAFAGLEKTASRGQRLLRFEGETVGAARPDVIGLLV